MDAACRSPETPRLFCGMVLGGVLMVESSSSWIDVVGVAVSKEERVLECGRAIRAFCASSAVIPSVIVIAIVFIMLFLLLLLSSTLSLSTVWCNLLVRVAAASSAVIPSEIRLTLLAALVATAAAAGEEVIESTPPECIECAPLPCPNSSAATDPSPSSLPVEANMTSLLKFIKKSLGLISLLLLFTYGNCCCCCCDSNASIVSEVAGNNCGLDVMD
mmetsp:Transcript_3204/g.5280  ORF Transcript_3204/g.5280 Transcript_3204/m.5280 type:complete len:217 (+) Transcript_3204:4272-4922(+)